MGLRVQLEAGIVRDRRCLRNGCCGRRPAGLDRVAACGPRNARRGRRSDPALPHHGDDGAGPVYLLDHAHRRPGDSRGHPGSLRMRRAAVRSLPLLLLPLAAFAHEGEPLEPHDLWIAWSFDPGVVIPLVLAAFLYLRGARTARGITPRQQACFWAGWTILALALVSPLHPLGEVLFSAHMGQHE